KSGGWLFTIITGTIASAVGGVIALLMWAVIPESGNRPPNSSNSGTYQSGGHYNGTYDGTSWAGGHYDGTYDGTSWAGGHYDGIDRAAPVNGTHKGRK